MRVVLLVTDLERGGAPLRLASTARLLTAHGVEVHVGCLAPRGPISAELEAAGIPTFACDARGATDWRALFRLRDQVKAIRPQLIHATLVHANVAARLVGRQLAIPVVTSTATVEVEKHWHRWIERITHRLSAAHIVNSAALADHVRRDLRIPSQRIRVIPAFLDPADIPPRDAARARFGVAEHEFVVAWVGRFDAIKRLDVVIRCAEIMSDRPCRFLLAGDGPDRASVERLIRTGSAGRRVTLLGWVENPYEVLAAADAFVFPSRTEGRPNAVMQAMRAGLPIVASDIAAHRELAGDPARLIVISGDAPADYARMLTQLMDDTMARAALASRAREFATRTFDPETAIRELISIYQDVLDKK